jgi:hypothetical protein
MSDQVRANDGFDDDTDSNDKVRVIVGEKWSFTNECVWVNSDEEPVPTDREVVVVSIQRVLQKWIDQAPDHEATKFLAPGEHVDVDELNEACPKTEWSEDLNGRPRGPWQIQSIVYMVDPANMQRFTYPTSTVGGNIAIGELKEAVKMMRKFKGAGIYPVVTLGTKPMKTRFSARPRPRPYFAIMRWFRFDSGEPAAPLAAPPSPKQLGATASASALTSATVAAAAKGDAIDKLIGASIVEEPTLHEQLNDEIPTNW